MAVTAEQLYRSLIDLVGKVITDLYGHGCDNADDYNNQLREIREQHNQMIGEQEQQTIKASHLHINNPEFMNCLNKAKQKMTNIEEKRSKDFIASQDLLQRTILCIYDTVHDYINEKLKHS